MYSLAQKNTMFEQSEKLDISEILSCIYFAICFWEQYLNLTVGSVTKYFLIVIILIMAIKRDKFYFKNYHFCMLLWFFIRVFSILWVDETSRQMVKANIISMIGMVLYFVVITATKHSANFVKMLMFSCYASSFGICLASVFFSKPYHLEKANRLVLTIFGAQNDPNNDAALKLFCFVFALYFVFVAKKHRWIHIIAMLISAYTIFLTASRGAMLAVIVALFVMFLSLQKKYSFTKKIFVLVGFCLVAGITYFVAREYLPTQVFERLFIEEYGTGSNRTVLWDRYMPLFYRSPLWGSGWGCYWLYQGSRAGCHNIYVEVLVETGILGFLGLFYPILKSIYYSFKRKKQEMAIAVLMISELVISFFLGSINKRFFWLPIIMCVISGLNVDSEEDK